MKKIILGRVLAFGLMFGMACTMMPNTVIKAAVESNSTEETVHIGDNEFTSYEELESGLKNVANVQQDSDTGIITVTMQKNVVGRICFDIKGAHIIFDGNGKTLSGQGYEEPICLQNFKHSIVELVGGGIYKTGYNNCIYTGAEDKLIIRNAVIIGNLSPYSDNYAGLENGYKSYSVMRLNETGDYVVNSQGMQLKNWVEDVNLYGLVDRDFAVVPTNNEHVHAKHLTKVEEKEATCTENGNKEYYKCSCGELFADKDAQKEITLAEVEIEAKGHEYETEYTKDAKYHWKKCKNCDAVTEKQEHTSSGEATEETAEICTECGYVMNPALEHIHTRHLTKVEAKAATCTENGNKAYYKCSCGELFADKDAQKEITLAEVEIEAKGHEYETEYTKDAKYHWKKCKNCDAVTEKQEHTSSGAATEENAETCTVCGYVIHEKLQKESNDSSMQWQTLNNSLSNVAYEIISYEKTEPTSATEGKISGIVSLAIGGCSTLIPFDYVITKVAEPQKPAQITGKGAQTTDGQIKISWIKADGADGYRIYASVCDGESNYKLIKDTKDLTGAIKNLNNKKSYKFYVVAYKNVDGKKVRICKSMIYHVVLSDSKYTNVKAIKVAKTSYTLNVGDKQKLNAKSVKQEKNKKLLTHAQEFRYSSSDTTVATVSKTGEITAKQSGSCIIYVVANNGVMKKIKVNVA